MDEQTIDLQPTEVLTDWPNQPKLLDLKQDFEATTYTHRDYVTNIKKWRELRDVNGISKPKKIRGRSSVQPKLIRRQNEWRYAALTEPFLGSTKLYKVSPVTWEDHESAKQNELVLNWQFRTKMNIVKFIDEMVRTTVDEGTCIIRIGWERETELVKVQVPIIAYMGIATEEEANQLEQAAMLRSENPAEYNVLPDLLKRAVEYYEETGIPSVAVETGETQEIEQEKIIVNAPTLSFINPENLYVDPTCQGDLTKARFAVHTFETSKAELAKDGRYKNLNAIDFNSSDILSAPDHVTDTPQTFQFKDTLRKRILAYEYWGLWDIDGSGKLKPIVATWIGNTLIRMEENPFPDQKMPFVLIPYLPVIRKIFGETDAELLEDNQKILGAVTRGMIDLMAKSANSQTGTAKGMLDAINKKRFDEGSNYEFNPNQHPNNGMVEHKYPEFSQSSLTMLQLQNTEAESLTGVKSFSGGMSGNAYGEVAAGIRGMLDAASKREMAILRRLAQGMKEIGTKIIMMNQQFLSEQEVVRVTNDEFVTVRREDLAGDYDLQVDIATAEVDNAKAQDLGFMLQTIGPDMDIGQRNLILSEIAELKRMPKLAHMLKNYKPTPDPLLEKAKELEILKLQKEIEELDSKIQLNNAKAKESETKADLNDLDFVETETGTKHERDLQRISQQANANQDLEVTKGLLKAKKEGESGGDIPAAIGYNRLTENRKNPYAAPRTQLANRPFVGEEQVDPSRNLGSKYYSPSSDPTLNPALNLG